MDRIKPPVDVYSIRQPLATHFRPASCAEFECEPYLNGWATTVDTSTDIGAQQADYIRKMSGRKYSETHLDATAVLFVFEPGQKCFGGRHQVSLERPATFAVAGAHGRIHTRPEHWVEDFSEHLQQVREDRS